MLSDINTDQCLSFPYRADRRYFLEIRMNPEWSEDDLNIQVDGHPVTNNYFDDNVYGPFIDAPFSRAVRVVITGEALQKEFSKHFQYSLKLYTGGYHDIEWNYRYLYIDNVNQFSALLDLDEEYTFPDGLQDAMDVDLIRMHEGPDRVEFFIPKAYGVDIEIELNDGPVNDAARHDTLMDALMQFAEGSTEEFQKACEAGVFTVLNVPEFRAESIRAVFSKR